MARPKIEVTGLAATDRYLNASVAIRQGASVQFGVVKIPLDWLLSEHVTEALDRQVRRDLIQRWSEVDLTDPLF